MRVLPLKTTAEDIDALGEYLKSQVGWTPIDKVKKALPQQYSDNRKLEAMRHIGLLERDGGNIKLSDVGRAYAQGDDATRASLMRARLRQDSLYAATMEWIHYHKRESVTKTDVANYWHDHHQADLQGASGAALTDGVIFFMRMAEVAGLGSFATAGKGRETHLKVNQSKLEESVTGEKPPVDAGTGRDLQEPPQAPLAPRRTATAGTLTLNPALSVTVQIHIAADAKPSTIEEIFKNMRRYLAPNQGGESDGNPDEVK